MADIRSLGVAFDYRKHRGSGSGGGTANGATHERQPNNELQKGSDVEIAERLIADLNAEFGTVIFCEGQMYGWVGTHWTILDDDALLNRIKAYDGAFYPTANGQGRIRLNKSRIESIQFVARSLIAAPDFFQASLPGINCTSGFITFGADGQPSQAPHAQDQRQRHVLPGRWAPGEFQLPTDSLLARLLSGCFRGDTDASEKSDLLAEIVGAAALGIGTRLRAPKAVIFYGASAENGKSQVLDAIRALLPSTAIAALSPKRFSDERFLIKLAGIYLNATDELGGGAIFSDDFKAVITGDPVTGKEIYRSATQFRPIALHVLATNKFPVFQDGMDAGVRRRLLVIPFNRTIPDAERIEGLGKKIGTEEADLLLAWAVAGASRLIARGAFPDLRSSRLALAEWILLTDPVGGWLGDVEQVIITGDPNDKLHSRDAYRRFRTWAQEEGIPAARVPIKGQFTQAVGSSGMKGLHCPRRRAGVVFVGMRRPKGDGEVKEE